MDPATYGTRYRYRCATDNYDPPRHVACGELWRGVHPVTGDDTVVLVPADGMERDAARALYLMDDGATVVPFYVAGWGGRGIPEGAIILRPFPVNPDGRTRPDGRTITYDTWQVGPRRAFHLKLTRADT